MQNAASFKCFSKKVELILSSKIIQAACLFLFSGSVGKLSFDHITVDKVPIFLQNSLTCNQFLFFSFYFVSQMKSRVNSFNFFMQICPSEKTNISFQLNAPSKRGEEAHWNSEINYI